MVMALNMMDEVEKNGAKIDLEGLSEQLGIAVKPIIAVKKKGIQKVMDEVIKLYQNPDLYQPHVPEYAPQLESEIATFVERAGSRSEVLLALDGDETRFANLGLDPEQVQSIAERLTQERYSYVEQLTNQNFFLLSKPFRIFSDRLDRLILNPILGMPLFVLVMLFVFKLTFVLGNLGLDQIDFFFAETLSLWVNNLFATLGVSEWLRALVVDGIIGGVGGVLTFVPNIAIMFMALSFLEDSGYMARVAFIMDPFLRKVGLNGKAFIPMILGFGCNVPAIMATRTLDSQKDRLLTILINPFMSCGARLPVYVLFAGAFFPGNEFLVMGSLYFLGIAMALFAALILRKTILKAEESHFVMEIPPYRLPSLSSLLIHVWERVKGYLVKAGTVIFAASVLLWFVLNFNLSGMTEMNNSFGAMLGGAIGVVLEPLGFGTWQAGLSLLTGLIAKEVVVSNMAIAYGFSENIDAAGFYQNMSAHFTQVAAYAFLVFVLLYTPCVAVIGAVKKETNSWKWTVFSVVYQLVVAWVVAFFVYQVGSLIF